MSCFVITIRYLLFSLDGLVPFNEWGRGGVTHAAWIWGDDRNLRDSTIRSEMKQYQPPGVWMLDERLAEPTIFF